MSRLPFTTVAITGKAGVGKTSVTNILAGKSSTIRTFSPDGTTAYEWDKIAFATPLKELINIKRDLAGGDKRERRLYEIHETLTQIYSRSPLYGAPDYDVLVDMVKQIEELPLGSYRDNYRTFQQTTGDLVRSHNKDAFCTSLFQRAITRINNLAREDDKIDSDTYVVSGGNRVDSITRILVVSDLRFNNEAKLITEKMGGIIYELTASDDVRNQRLASRDGDVISEKNANHKSEKGIKPKYISQSINTDNLTEVEIADMLRADIYSRIR